jgi:hypothetical protein
MTVENNKLLLNKIFKKPIEAGRGFLSFINTAGFLVGMF